MIYTFQRISLCYSSVNFHEKRYVEEQKECQSERVDEEIEIKLKMSKEKGMRV